MSSLADSDSDKPAKQRQAICFQAFRDSKKKADEEDCPDCDEKRGKITKIDNELMNNLQLPKFPLEFNMTFPITKKFDEGRVIAGYASVSIIDKQKDIIPIGDEKIPGLKEAWERCGKSGQVRPHLMHTNIPVGELLEEYTESDGTVHTSQVDEAGLYVVAKIWDNTKKANETWDYIQGGELGSFSIGGEALADTLICDTATGRECHTRIDKLDLHEISIVQNPANKSATFRVLKFDELLEKYDKWTKNVTKLYLHSRPSGDEGVISSQGEGDLALDLGENAESNKEKNIGDSMTEETKDLETVEKKKKKPEEEEEDKKKKPVEKDMITREEFTARIDKLEDLVKRLVSEKEAPVETVDEVVEKVVEKPVETVKPEPETEKVDFATLVEKKVQDEIRKMLEVVPTQKRSTKPVEVKPVTSPLDLTEAELVGLDGEALMRKAGFVKRE